MTSDWVPNVCTCVAMKTELTLHKVMAAEFMGIDIGSW